MKNYFTEDEMNALETSLEIAQAISERANGSMHAMAIWIEGTDCDLITKRAFELAEEGTDKLYWGNMTLKNSK